MDTQAFSSDRPIASSEEDKLSRWPFAQRLADTIVRTDTKTLDTGSLVIGLYGKWGEGKTSLIVLLEQALAAARDVVKIRFNPWYFRGEEAFLRGFFSTLAHAVGGRLETSKERIGEVLSDYGAFLGVAGIGDATKGLGGTLSRVSVETLKLRIGEILKASGLRVVVFIDDIDRLDRNEIQSIFKLVKLSADFPCVSYVLAFDEEVVAAALGERYAEGRSESGRSFLEKIIQVPLYIPRADSRRLLAMGLECVKNALAAADIALTSEQAGRFERLFVDAFESCLTTPRQVARYGNAIQFAVPLLKGEVHPVDQLLVEGIRVLFPTLYTMIRNNATTLLGRDWLRGSGDNEDKDRARLLINYGLKNLNETSQHAAKGLIEALFPQVAALYQLNTSFTPEEEIVWAREQRICSDQYFSRYFRYAVPVDDITDRFIDEITSAASAGDGGRVESLLRHVHDDGLISRAMEKIRWRSEMLPGNVASILAVAIAKNGSLLISKSQRGEESISKACASLVNALVERQWKETRRPGGREVFSQEILVRADPLQFAVTCFEGFKPRYESSPRESGFEEGYRERLGRVIADRIGAAADKGELSSSGPSVVGPLLIAWKRYGKEGEIQSYLTEKLRVNPTEVASLLKAFVSQTSSPDGRAAGRPFEFDRRSYDALAECVDPDIVVGHVENILSGAIGRGTAEERQDEPVFQEFLGIHRRVREEAPSRGE